jgi:hypothetical protein
MSSYMGMDTFSWFHAIIEEVNDPLMLGRCRIRVIGLHTDNRSELPTNKLPWASPMMPITSASIGGIGISPTGVMVGSWVIGFFRDGENSQDPIIMGTVPGIPSGAEEDELKYGDPSKTYPYKEETPQYNSVINESDVNRLARGAKPNTVFSSLSEFESWVLPSAFSTITEMSDVIGSSNMLSGASNIIGDASSILGQGASGFLGDASSILGQGASGFIGDASSILGQGASNIIGDASSILGQGVTETLFGLDDFPLLEMTNTLLVTNQTGPLFDLLLSSSNSVETIRSALLTQQEFAMDMDIPRMQTGIVNSDLAKDLIKSNDSISLYGDNNTIRPINENTQGVVQIVDDDGGSSLTLSVELSRIISLVGVTTLTQLNIQGVHATTSISLDNGITWSKYRRDHGVLVVPKNSIRGKVKVLIDRIYGTFISIEFSKASNLLLSENTEKLRNHLISEDNATGLKNLLLSSNLLTEQLLKTSLVTTPFNDIANMLVSSDLGLELDIEPKSGVEGSVDTIMVNKMASITNNPLFTEPPTKYAPMYPNNKVLSTESGHHQEFDDTPGAERIHTYHKSGSFEEYHPNGDRVTKIVGNDYEIVSGDKNLHVSGDLNIYVNDSVNITVNGKWFASVGGTHTTITGGTTTKLSPKINLN